MIETGSKAVCISTYNGIAYSFAKEMTKRFKDLGINVDNDIDKTVGYLTGALGLA